MKSELFIKQEAVTLFNITSEFDTSEEIALGDLYRNISKYKNGMKFKVFEFEHPLSKTNIPILLIGEQQYVDNVNVDSEYVKTKILGAFKSGNSINIFENTDILSKKNIFLGYKWKSVLTNDCPINIREKKFPDLGLFNILEFGSLFIIVPNHSFIYFEENELKKGTYGAYHIKKTLLKKSSFRKLLQERKTELKEYMYSTIREIPKKYKQENLCILNFRNFLVSGVYVGFMDKKYLKTLDDKRIVPFNADADNNTFVFKTKEEIDTEYNERVKYEKEKEKAKKPFIKVIKKLEASGKDWCSLNTDGIKKFDNEWHIWLNPWGNRGLKYGWFKLEDLKDWLNGKGAILESNSKKKVVNS